MPERDALSSKSKLSSQAFSLPPSYRSLKFDITAFRAGRRLARSTVLTESATGYREKCRPDSFGIQNLYISLYAARNEPTWKSQDCSDLHWLAHCYLKTRAAACCLA